MLSLHVIILALIGLAAGVPVEGIISSFHYDGSLWPRPRCRACGHRAPAFAWIPVVGFLRHRSCPACGRAQWARALQVQAATAACFALLGAQYWGYPLLLGVSMAEAALLVAVLFIDLELRLIPTLLVALLVALALGSAALWPGLGLWQSVLGGALGFGSFGLLVMLARLAFGEGALGMGDANLALAIGCITGYPLVVFSLSFGVFLGGIGAIAVLIVARRGLRSTIPYGPYLVLGVLYVLIHGNTLSPLVRF